MTIQAFVEQLFILYMDGGGWVGFLLFSAFIFLIVLADNQINKRNGFIWLLLMFVCLLTFVPAAIYTLGAETTRVSLQGSRPLIFYAGLLGGIIPVFLAIGYWLTRPISETRLGREPILPPTKVPTNYIAPNPSVPPAYPPQIQPPSAPLSDGMTMTAQPVAVNHRRKAPVLLKLADDDSATPFQLYYGTNTIGRNQVFEVFVSDQTVTSKGAAQIIVDDSTIIVQDIGDPYGVRINDIRIQGRADVYHGNKITVGKNVNFIVISQGTR